MKPDTRSFLEALETGNVNEILDSHLIDRIEELRTRVNIRRTRMLFAMYRILSAEQRKALSALHPPGRFLRP